MGLVQRLVTWYRANTAAPFIPPGLRFHCLPLPQGRPFEHGVELLNDDKTPVLVVSRVLREELRLSPGDAAIAAALCHQKGGVIVPLASLEQAQAAVRSIAARAQRDDWPLACRAVSSAAVD